MGQLQHLRGDRKSDTDELNVGFPRLFLTYDDERTKPLQNQQHEKGYSPG